MLNITIEHSNQGILMKCRGRIVHGEETLVLCTALPYHGHAVTVDLAEVSTVDAAGIGAFLTLQAAGVYVRLLNPSLHVREVLRVTNLDSVVEILESGPSACTTSRESGASLHPCSIC